MKVKTINTFLVGLGNVNRSFLRILEMKGARLATEYGLAFRVVAVADSSGVALPKVTLRSTLKGGTQRTNW